MVDRLQIERAEERHQLRTRISELAAENERLRRLVMAQSRAIHSPEALSRTGAVKVKAWKAEAARDALIEEAKDFSERMTSQPWACELIDRLIAALEPAAPEPIAKGLLSDDEAKAAGLGKFGHHPDPAIDFEIEVESLQARLIDTKGGNSKPGTKPEAVAAVLEDIERAMTFRVGGVPSAVRAKQTLRDLEADAKQAGQPAASEGRQEAVAWMNSDHLEDYRQGNLDGGIAWAWREQTDFYDTPLYETPQPAPSAEPGFEIAPDNGIQEQVIAYILDCARRWVPEARIIGNARAGDIVRALSSQPVTEPFGYYCECKGADPAFLRKPAYIPPTDDLHTTTPLYTRPSEQAVTEAQVAAANGAFIDAFINGGSVFEGAEISGVNFDVCMRAALKAAMEAG